jgi:hypothetical protein
MSAVNVTLKVYEDYKDPSDLHKYVETRNELVGSFEIGTVISNITLDDNEAKDMAKDFYTLVDDNLPLTVSNSTNVIKLYYSKAYRKEIYDLERNSLSDSVVNQDVDVLLKLIATTRGDIHRKIVNYLWYTDVDKADEEHLKLLCGLIGYKWVDSLGADKQRESIKFFLMLRRLRGTKFALKNLIRIFGQSADTLYQATDLSGVRIFDYTDGNTYNMFPGDIRIEIPDMSSILRNAIEEIKLMGTRLTFTYRISLSSSDDELGMKYREGIYLKLKLWNTPGFRGWDRQLATDLDRGWSTRLESIFCRQIIYYYRDVHNIVGTTNVLQEYSPAFTLVDFLSTPGQTNVRGIINNDSPILNNLVLYR